jgi:hypothetical protein
VQRNNLSADEVVSSSETLGHGERPLSAVRIEDLSAPRSSGARVAVFSDLEERCRLRRLRIGDLRHVDVYRAVVVAANGGLRAAARTGLRVHLDSEGTTGCVTVLLDRIWRTS